jgi:flagellar biosynthetic protein FlhB
MAEQDQNRSEAATPFKLDEARKRGSVPKSLDVNTLGILMAGAAVLHFWGNRIVSDEMRLFGAILSNAHQTSFEFDDIAALVVRLFSESIAILAPLFATIGAIAALANFFQTGPVFSFFPLKPDFGRVNPVSGFQRIFSLRLVVESVKTVLKFALLGTVFFFAVQAALPALLESMNMAPLNIGRVILPQASTLLVRLLVALSLVTLLDATYSRWDFAKRMRMSRREVRDEIKRREGDPRVKSRLRELQREAVKRARSLGRVKDADVLITNPVRLAIAIKYDRERIDAPLVIAKGAGFLAARMREIEGRVRPIDIGEGNTVTSNRVSFQLLAQVRNKVLEAYQDLLRMQI